MEFKIEFQIHSWYLIRRKFYNFLIKILNSDTKPQICVIPLPCVGKKNIFDWKEKKLLPGIHRPVA